MTVELDAGHDLTIGGRIIDHDRIGSDDTLFSAEHTFAAGGDWPAHYTLTNRLLKLIVRIEILEDL